MENKPSEPFSNIFAIPPTNGPAYVDKETLKQIVLVQEAMFRKQVSDLHHVYKVQKNLMAVQCRKEELNGHSQGRSYPSPSEGIRKAQQVGPPAGQGMKKPSENFRKGKNLACSSNGSTKRMLDIQVPADAFFYDSDDDGAVMWEVPANQLPINNGSVVGTNVKLNIEGSSRMNKNGITGLQPSAVSTVNLLNKEVVGSSSTMKGIDYPGVGASSSQNQCYSSGRMNLNLPSSEDNLKEKHVGAAFGSKSVAANEETRHSNSYSQKKDDRSNGMEWFTHKKNGVDSSTGHCLSSSSISNPQIFAASSSNAAFKSQWQSSSTDYTARRQYADAEMHFSQNDRLPTFQEYRGLHSSEIPGGGQYQKHPPFYDCPEDVNLNSGLRDENATLGQACENTPMEISWVRTKLLNMRNEVSMKKSLVPSSCVNGNSQILPGYMAYSEGSTRIFGCTISAATEKGSQSSSTVHMGIDIAPLVNGVANMQIHVRDPIDLNVAQPFIPQEPAVPFIDLNAAPSFMDDMEIDARQSDGNTVPQEPDVPFIDMNVARQSEGNTVPQEPDVPFIDRNVALPFMDDREVDARQSEGDSVPQEPVDPFNEALAITAAKNLTGIHKDEIQAGSPDILHWFSDLAISGENTVVYNRGSNNGGNSEALTPRLLETKDCVTAHRRQPKAARGRKTRSAAASTFNASYRANSSRAAPPEDSGTVNERRRSLRSYRGKK